MFSRKMIALAGAATIAASGLAMTAVAMAGDEDSAAAAAPKVYVAVTDQEGRLVGGVGVKSVTYPVDGDGSFNVKFAKPVDKCALLVSSARFQFSAEAAPRTGDKKSVYVFMHNSAGQGGPGAFYLVALCP